MRRLLVLAVPSDPAVLEAISAARRLNPRIRILCSLSIHLQRRMEAHRRGANQVIIEEQVVAQEFQRRIESSLAHHPEPIQPAANS